MHLHRKAVGSLNLGFLPPLPTFFLGGVYYFRVEVEEVLLLLLLLLHYYYLLLLLLLHYSLFSFLEVVLVLSSSMKSTDEGKFSYYNLPVEPTTTVYKSREVHYHDVAKPVNVLGW